MVYTPDSMRSLVNTCIGRRTDYAIQQADGRYRRAHRSLTYDALRLHLEGSSTLGTYVIDEQGTCRFALFDSDLPDGLSCLVNVQQRLAADGISSYLEASRRGGHLWVFLASLLSPDLVRAWLMPYYPGTYQAGAMEFYPKQEARMGRPGSLMRVPLGVHRLSGRRYPFLAVEGEKLVPVVGTVSAALIWLSTVERVQVPETLRHTICNSPKEPRTRQQHPIINQKNVETRTVSSVATIADWCCSQDAFQMIGRYVALDSSGAGCCPFGDHHSDGVDSHPSFFVYSPRLPSVNCWYCHVWQRGGSLFDFLRYYHGLSARALWHRILTGEQF